jgi:hypothetical protein
MNSCQPFPHNQALPNENEHQANLVLESTKISKATKNLQPLITGILSGAKMKVSRESAAIPVLHPGFPD